MKLIEALAVAIIFVAISLLAWAVQDVTVAPGPDGQYYFRLTQAFATDQPIDVEAPAAYRIALPWLVSYFFPTRIIDGYRVFNIVIAAAITFLFVAWLRNHAIGGIGLRLLLVALFLSAWCGPARFVYFYPVYVDPLFILVLFAGLLLIHALKARYGRLKLGALTALCFVGACTREAVVLLPVAFAFVNNPLPLPRAHGATRAVPLHALGMPAIGTALGLAIVWTFVDARPAPSNILLVLRDESISAPLPLLALSFFVTFGPVIALVAYDWREAGRFLNRNQYLAVLLASVVVLAYLGYPDTERVLVWSAPVVYVLTGAALMRHRRALLSIPLMVSLVLMQVLAARLFWGVPDPQLRPVPYEELQGLGNKIYGVLNRLFVFDSFYGNLWSLWGSRPFA